MPAFHEILFPVDISLDSGGGPQFRTSVFTADSGYELRHRGWAQTRAEYDVSYGIKDQSQMDILTAFFWCRRGRAYGFRFKDWSDYRLNGATFLGTGEAEVQITKTYTSTQTESGASHSFTRTITKPAWDTIAGLTVDAVVKTSPTDYTVDYTTGIITFVSAPAAGAVISIGSGEFHVPVRFDDDHLAVKHEFWNTVSWDAIKLVEDRPDWDAVIGVVELVEGGDPVSLFSIDFFLDVYSMEGISVSVDDLVEGDATFDATGRPNAPFDSGNPDLIETGIGAYGDMRLTSAALDLVTAAEGATFVIDFYARHQFDEVGIWGLASTGVFTYLAGDRQFEVSLQTAFMKVGALDDGDTDSQYIAINDSGDLSVEQPGTFTNGNHKVAVTFQNGQVNYSLDGGDVVTALDASVAENLMENIVFAIKPFSYHDTISTESCYAKSIVAYSPVNNLQLPILSANACVPPSYPSPVVPPIEVFTADFTTETYTIGGSTVTAEDLIVADDPLLGVTFDASTDVVPGVGSGSGLKGFGITFDLAVAQTMLENGGVTAVVEYECMNYLGFTYLGEISLTDEEYYYEVMSLEMHRGTSSLISVWNDPDAPYNVVTPVLSGAFTAKVAVTHAYDHVSVSINGATAQRYDRVAPLGATLKKFNIYLGNTGGHPNVCRIRQVTAYSPYDDADLPGLST